MIYAFKEVHYCLENTTENQLRTLSIGTSGNLIELSETDLLRAGLYDWLRQIGGFDANDALQLVMKFKDDLLGINVGDNLDLPPASFNILDGQYISCLHPASYKGGGTFYDIKTGKTMSSLPHHVLSGLSCNLNVLVARLAARIKKVRQLEPSDADDRKTGSRR